MSQPSSKCIWKEGFTVAGLDGVLAEYASYTRDQCCAVCKSNPNCAAATSAVVDSSSAIATAVVRGVNEIHQGGRYGRWEHDEDELPVYCYTLDQAKDTPTSAGLAPPRANGTTRWSESPPLNGFGMPGGAIDTTARGAREHSFHLGNDRITLVGSNYGSFRVRQDEGGPKWLNDANVDDPSGHLHGGGFGYLYDGGRGTLGGAAAAAGAEGAPYYKQPPILTTAFTSTVVAGDDGDDAAAPAQAAEPRRFGIGYATTAAIANTAGGWTANHTVAVAPGTTPTVLVEVVITNNGAEAREVTWVEVWGTGMVHQLTFKGWGGWATKDEDPAVHSLSDRRAFVNNHYSSSFHNLHASNGGNVGIGVSQQRKFHGLTKSEDEFYRGNFDGTYLPPPRASLWDRNPPEIFLVSLSHNNNTVFGNNAKKFFGNTNSTYSNRSGITHPTGEVVMDIDVAEGETALLASTEVTVPAGQSAKLQYVFGYVPVPTTKGTADPITPPAPTQTANDIVDKVKHWFSAGSTPPSLGGTPFLADEMLWHSFYLQSAVSFDTFYNESIIDQGTAYRYHAGFQGAIRDPLQHALPFIHTRPELVKSVIRYSLQEMQPSVNIILPGSPVEFPDSMIGSGVVRGNTPRPDDFELYLFWCVSEYILATKDVAFFKENVTGYSYNSTSPQGETRTVLQALIHALGYTENIVGFGPHDLLRLLTSDWDDGFKPPAAAFNVSESVLTSALAAYVLPRFAEALKLAIKGGGGGGTGASKAAETALTIAGRLKKGLKTAAWNGKWLRRAWLGPVSGWAGDAPGCTGCNSSQIGMYSAPLGWAMMAGIYKATPELAKTAAHNVVAECRDAGWMYGFGYRCNKSYSSLDGAGTWPAVNHPLILGFLESNMTKLAWSEFLRNTLQRQATISPSTWVGIWTAGDVVEKSGLPGKWTWDFPALCTHRHAYPLFTLPSLAGVSFTAAGVKVSLRGPETPWGLAGASFETPLASLVLVGDADDEVGHAGNGGDAAIAAAAVPMVWEGAGSCAMLQALIYDIDDTDTDDSSSALMQQHRWSDASSVANANVATFKSSTTTSRGIRFAVRCVKLAD
eukprot:gene16853-26961_t